MVDRTPPDRAQTHPAPLVPWPHQDPIATPIPTPLTSFIGRDRDVATVAALLARPDVRLVTLTGPGGVGKTCLALAVAEVLAPECADGAALVELAPIGDPDLVPSTVAQALGIRPSKAESPTAALARSLRGARLLLVLDNFEHLLPAAPLVADLLAACPDVRVLVTSRARLRLRGEREVTVPPLEVPDAEHLPPVEELAGVAAVRLFVERAREVRPDFGLTLANAPAVAEVCQRLDGLPLALELAAAWTKILPPAALLGRLERRLSLLTGGARDLPARQRTLEATIAWSHDLLTADERTLFRRLSVFVGGCTLDAVEQVMGNDVPWSPGAVLDLVASLVDKSLLTRREQGDRQPRFVMLETIREFAAEQLAASGEEAEVRRRHAKWCVELAEQAWFAVTNVGAPSWPRWLEAEYENLRTALAWLAERGDGEATLRLAGALAPYWHSHSQRTEGRQWLERALVAGQDAPAAIRARALLGIANLASAQRAYEPAAAAAQESLALCRSLGDTSGTADSLALLGFVLLLQEHYEPAAALYEEACALYQQVGNDWLLAMARSELGMAVRGLGEDDRAVALFEEAVAVHRTLADPVALASTLLPLALVTADQGNVARAATLYQESLDLWRELSQKEGLIDCLAAVATLAATAGQPTPAVRLFGAAEAFQETLDYDYVVQVPARDQIERSVGALRAELGDVAFAAAWAAGRTLTPEQACAEASTMLGAVAQPAGAHGPHDPASSGGLTPRERDVLALVAQGLTDREIADTLFLSTRTVNVHVGNILSKLNVSSRRQAAQLARDRDAG